MTSSDRNASAFFVQFLQRSEAGEDVDFETFCADHASHAAELRKLHDDWVHLGEVLQCLGLSGAFTGRVEQPQESNAASSRPTVPLDAAQGARATSVIPQRIGSFTIVRVIDSGGMGTVYLAEQDRPRREVALKIMRHGLTSVSSRRRFEFESHALSLLRHPGIAQVYEAGIHHDAAAPGNEVPYFAMEYVPGARSLSDYAIQHELDFRSKLTLFLKVCDAVEHGHLRGIVHRDLKPSNILVDEDGRPKVIDFGLARATEFDGKRAARTVPGEIFGTPQYMSPEQFSGIPDAVDLRTDVYALGVILYELLCGRLPHDLSGLGIQKAMRVVREERPQPPRTVQKSIAADLETIMLKALEKDRDRRYVSVAAFATDIRRYINYEPIAARRSSTAYHMRMFVRRNRAVVSLACVVVVALITVSVVSTVSDLRTKRALSDLELVASFQEERLSKVDAERLGRSVLDDLRRRVLEAAVDQGVSEQEVERSAAALDGVLETIDATSLARTVFDENILRDSVEDVEARYGDRPAIAARLLAAIARAYISLGLYPAAEEIITRSLEIGGQARGANDAVMLEMELTLGVIQIEQGRWEEAIPLLRGAADRYLRTSGSGDTGTLEAHYSLVVALAEEGYGRVMQGELELARKLLAEAETIQRNVLAWAGGSDFRPAESRSILGLVLEYRGELERALGRERRGDQESEDRFRALLEEAVGYYRAALKIARREGDESVLAGVLNSLGPALRKLGQLEEAEPLHVELLELCRRELGNEHPNTLIVANNLAILWCVQERSAEAVELLSPLLELAGPALGTEHPFFAMISRTLERARKEADPAGVEGGPDSGG